MILDENDNERLLADGSVLTESETDYLFTRKYPNGLVAEYRNDYEGRRELFLTKEAVPDGKQVTYDYKRSCNEETQEDVYEQVKLYERDSNGHYISYKYKRDDYDEIEHLTESVEGVGDKWTKKTFYDEKEEPIYYQADGDETKKYYPSGKLMEEVDENGAVFGYYETGILKSEEYPNGVVKEYAPDKQILYARDEDGNYQRFQLNRDGTGTLLIEKGKGHRFNERYQYDENDYLVQKEVNTPKGVLMHIYYPGSEQQIKEEIRPDGTSTTWSKTNKKTYEKLIDGSYKKYSNGRDYQRFDRRNNLIEDVNVFGRTTYTYYANTDKLKHIHKYNESGYEITGAYRHFDKDGNDNTAYYLARKKIIEKRLEQEDERARRRGIDRIKAIRKKRFRKIAKLYEHIKALNEIKEK